MSTCLTNSENQIEYVQFAIAVFTAFLMSNAAAGSFLLFESFLPHAFERSMCTHAQTMIYAAHPILTIVFIPKSKVELKAAVNQCLQPTGDPRFTRRGKGDTLVVNRFICMLSLCFVQHMPRTTHRLPCTVFAVERRSKLCCRWPTSISCS